MGTINSQKIIIPDNYCARHFPVYKIVGTLDEKYYIPHNLLVVFQE